MRRLVAGLISVLLLCSVGTGTAGAAPATTPAVVVAPAPRRPAPTSTTVEVHVMDRTGNPAPGAMVIAEGPSARNGTADLAGVVTLKTLAFGTYRFRAEGEGFITLEKEVALRAGTPVPPLEFALSATPVPPKAVLPLPPPPPPAAVVEPAPTIRPGEPRVVSLLDVAERALAGKEAIRTVPIGCSGLSRAQLLVVRDALQTPPQNDADDMLYVIAGEASMTLAGKTQAVESGWFSIVPRGAARTLTRKGKNPVIVLSMVGGPPCTADGL